jgi:hypothetical protein
MRYFRMGVGGRLEEASSAGNELFVQVSVFRKVGDAAYAPIDLRDELVPLDSLVGLVADRLAVLDAAAAAELREEKAKAKAKREKVPA